MNVLVTRPDADAGPLLTALATRGIDAVAAPLLRIVPIPAVLPPLDRVAALAFTSANGVRAFARLTEDRSLPVFAVGDATARSAREAGFRRVESANGAVDGLVALIADRAPRSDKAILHPAGRQVAGDLAGALRACGFQVDRVALYDAVVPDRLPDTAMTAMVDGALDGVLFFSPRTADTFVSLVQAAKLDEACNRLQAYCLSPAVAKVAGVLPWSGLLVAARPTTDSLLELIEQAKDSGKMPADDPAIGPAQRIIAAFGGIRPMAAKLGVAFTTVQGWKERDSIPAARRAQIEEAAKEHDIVLDRGDLDSMSVAGTEKKPAPPTQPVPPATPKPIPAAGKSAPDTRSPEPAAGKSAVPDRGPAQKADEPRPATTGAGMLSGAVSWLALILALGIVVFLAVGRDEGGPRDDLGPLRVEIDALRDTVDNLEPAGDSGATAAQLADIETRLAELAAAEPATDTGAVAALDARLDELEAANRTLAESMAGVTVTDGDGELVAIREAIDSLRSESETVSAEVAALEETVAVLRDRSTAEVTEEATARLQDARRLVLVAALRRAVESGSPYDTELAAFMTVFDDAAQQDSIEVLTGSAGDGVPGVAALAGRLESVTLESAPAESSNWLDAALDRLEGLVSVRRVDAPPSPENPTPAVRRAEERLAVGDVAGALTATDVVAGRFDALDDWRAAAAEHLAVRDALAAVERAAVTDSGATK